jgi:hypothetical protein
MIQRNLSTNIAALLIASLILCGCSALKPPETLADRHFSGYFAIAGVLQFTTRIDGKAIQPGLSYHLPAGRFDCAEGGKAPLMQGTIDQSIPYKVNKYVLKNPQLEFIGRPTPPNVLSGTLQLIVERNNGPCTVGPIDWTAYPWPQTVQEAVEMLIELAPEDIKKQMRTMPEEDLHIYNDDFGKWISHSFGLSESDGNTGLRNSCGSATISPEDCSAIIIHALWERINKE